MRKCCRTIVLVLLWRCPSGSTRSSSVFSAGSTPTTLRSHEPLRPHDASTTLHDEAPPIPSTESARKTEPGDDLL